MKELIYHDAINVLYMMKTHNIQFQWKKKERIYAQWEVVQSVFCLIDELPAKEFIFKVHPDDVHLYDAQDDDRIELASGQIGFYTPFSESEEWNGFLTNFPNGFITNSPIGEPIKINDNRILKVKERNGKEWFAPDEIKEV